MCSVFEVSRSVITMQREFCARFRKDVPQVLQNSVSDKNPVNFKYSKQSLQILTYSCTVCFASALALGLQIAFFLSVCTLI